MVSPVIGEGREACSYYDRTLETYNETIRRNPVVKPYAPSGYGSLSDLSHQRNAGRGARKPYNPGSSGRVRSSINIKARAPKRHSVAQRPRRGHAFFRDNRQGCGHSAGLAMLRI